MRYLVTGCAGFIGSTLTDRLIESGHTVVGVDSFTNYYSIDDKFSNLRSASKSKEFQLLQKDVRELSEGDLTGVDAVIHLAAQPGVRDSWSEFTKYDQLNINSTQSLLQLCVDSKIGRVVCASSSSIYGNQSTYPVTEENLPNPRSPYGVTKLAGEALCQAYSMNFGLEIASLRFFTVYGPRQRPDMAIHRILSAAINGTPFRLFGDGSARRDFTYVDDVAAACELAATKPLGQDHLAINIGGSGDTSMAQLIELIEEATGCPVDVRYEEAQLGDVTRTGADCSRASEILGWNPQTKLPIGLRQQAIQIRARLE